MRCLTVIVHHRGSEILTRCLESLLGELDTEDRVVVFCNGLEEELPPICEDPRILTPSIEEGVGFAKANNLGVERGREHFGEFDILFFLNNDTRLAPRALATLRRHLEDHPRCAVVGPRLMIEGAPDHINSLGLNVTDHGEAWDEGIGLHQSNYGLPQPGAERLAVTGAALMIRDSTFAELGGWSEIFDFYYEDLDLCIRTWRAGATVRLEEESVVHHRISASSGGATSDFKTMLSWRNQFLLLLLHWPFLRLLRVLPVVLAKQAALYYRRRRAGATHDATLQTRALRGAGTKLPALVGERYRAGRQSGWTRFLKKPGTVPVIELPDTGTAVSS